MNAESSQFHVLDQIVAQSATIPERNSTPLGGASHVKKGSAEDLIRKYHIEKMSQLPEDPAASLHGATAVQHELQKESADHRFVIYLKSQGKETKEIAELTGYCEVHVRAILAQPFARKQLARLLEASDMRVVIPEMIANAARGSVEVLIEIRDSLKAPESVRVKAASDLLDRFLGKPAQTLKHGFDKPMVPSDDMGELDRQMEQLKARERDLVGRPKVREVPEIKMLPDEPNQVA